MEDQELLELAAKAVGHVAHKSQSSVGLLLNDGIFWDPLEDDGDALRLAACLRIDLTFYNGFQEIHAEPSNSDGLSPSYEKFGDDISSAARRAIVRAAAEIGKGMP